MARNTRSGRWLLAILVLAAALRLIRLGTFPYWHDEVHNLVKAEHLKGVLTEGTLVSNHPPLFTILVAGWRAMGLDGSEWSMRGLPALLGVLIAAAAYWTASRLFNARAGLMSAFLVAISPFFLVHSQDVKEYIILPLTGTLLVWVLYEAANRNTVAWWIAYAVMAGVACYSDVYAAPLLVGLNVWFLLQLPGRANRLPGWVLANIAGAAMFAPYLGVLLRRADLMLVQSEQWWLEAPTLWHVVFLLKTMAFGYADSDPLFKIALACYGIAAGVGAVIVLNHGWRVGLLVLCWFAIPIASMFVGSHFVNSFFLIRAMLPFAVPFYVLTGVCLAQLENRAVRAAGIAVFAALAAVPTWHQYTRDLPAEEMPHRPGIHPPVATNDAARYIVANFREGDVVLHTSAPTWLPFYWYGLRGYPQFQAAVDGEHIHLVNTMGPKTTTLEDFAGYFPHDVRDVSANAKRVWLVFADWERAYLNGNSMQVWRWLNANFAERAALDFAGLDVRLFESLDDEGPPVYRNRDDGVSADVEWRADPRTRRVVTPDTGLIPQPPSARAGALRLSFEDEDSPSIHRVANTPDRRRISFSLLNTAARDRRVLVNALASDALLEAVRMSREGGSSVVWRTAPQHNPSGAPPNYELATAVVRFTEAGTAGLTAPITLPDGQYDTYVYTIATPGDADFARALLSVFVGDRDVLARAEGVNRGDAFGWRWMRGAAILASGEASEVRIVASHLLGLPDSFADVLYVAFEKRRGTPRPQAVTSYVDAWPGEVSIAGGEQLTWTVEMDRDIARVDVWAHDMEPDGRAYHIYDARHGD